MIAVGVYHLAAISLFLLIPVCSSQSCDAAKNCLAELISLSPSISCEDRLKDVAIFKKCVEENIVGCDTATKLGVQIAFDQAIALFTEACAGGCSDFIDKFNQLTSTCTVSVEHMTSYIISATDDWNHNNRTNETITGELMRIIKCIEDLANGCGIIRKVYGKLYQTYPSLPLVQQILGIYKEVNGLDESSPIIEDCPGLDVKDELLKIENTCRLSVQHTDSNGPDIIKYCAPIQTQIDCVLQWQSKCPVAVTRFLRPFMDSYGVIHSIFCNNITIHGFVLRSLSQTCNGDTYRRAYSECWKTIMIQLQEGDADHSTINPSSLSALFRLWEYKSTDNNICLVFQDTVRYNTTKMRECTKELDNQCPLPFPTHGNPIQIPDGLLYNDDLYKLLISGPMPFNQYGIVQLQYTRDHICYSGCAEYTTMNEEYIEMCQNKIRDLAKDLKSDDQAQIKTKCKSIEEKIPCISEKTMACPLFQYQASNLLDEVKVMKALTLCSIARPDLLPVDYTIKTTTLATPSSTSFWTASPSTEGVTQTSQASYMSKTSVLASLFFTFFIIVTWNL